MECSGSRQEISSFIFSSGNFLNLDKPGACKSQGGRKTKVMIESQVGVKGSELLSKTLSSRLVDGLSTETLVLSHNDDHAECFNEVVRRIKLPIQKNILEKMSGVTSDQMREIVQCCNYPAQILNHHRSFFTSDEFPYVNLRAFRDGIIDVNEFSTLASVQGIFKESSGQIESFEMMYKALFDKNGEPNKEAWEAIEETLQKSNDERYTKFKYEVKDTIKKMQIELKTARPLEAGFWHYDMTEPGRKITVADAVRCLGSWALSGYANQEMIPSITMIQAHLDSAFGEEAHRINPVIGSSSIDDIRLGGINCHRDFAIPFPCVPLPKSADGFPAPTIASFQRHDKYHLERVSLLINADKDLYIAMGDALKELQARYNDSILMLQSIYEKKKVYIEKVKNYIESLPEPQKKESVIRFQRELCKIYKLFVYLRKARKLTGRFKFYMYDLDFYSSHCIHKLHRQRSGFIYHLNELLLYINLPRNEPLDGVPARLAGRAVLPIISGNLDNPSQTYSKLCDDFGVKTSVCWFEWLAKQKFLEAPRNIEFIDFLKSE